MPAGDGVSLPTTIVQMGTVAKAQAQSQTTPNHTVPFSEKLANEDDLRVERLQESDDPDHEQVNRDGKKSDKRKRRRLKRKRKVFTVDTDETIYQSDEAKEQINEVDELGMLIDMRA